MKNTLIIFLVAVLGAVGLQAADNSNSRPLVVGTTSGYSPYVSINVEGEYEGFDIDFAYALSQKLGRQVSIKDLGSMPSLMMALKQGKIDMVIWAVSITKERMEKMEMVYYQGSVSDTTPVLFWEKVPDGIQSIGDIEKISDNAMFVEAGSYQEDILKAFPKINLKYADKVLDAIMSLKYGKCLATTIDPALVAGYMQKYPQLKVVYLSIPENLKVCGNGVAIRKDNQDLACAVRAAVSQMRDEGIIAELEKKWNIQG